MAVTAQAVVPSRANVLLIDNYDSFTYNLVHLLAMSGANVRVVLHDEISVADIQQIAPSHIVISPGPGAPSESGICLDVIRRYAGEIPILGVCLGHQCIAEVFGAHVVRAPQVMHGKRSEISHDGTGLFEDVPPTLQVGRYHSLTVDPSTIPINLEVTAISSDDLVMGIRHRELDVYGVQFHPESVLSEYGSTLMQNFLGTRQGRQGRVSSHLLN